MLRWGVLPFCCITFAAAGAAGEPTVTLSTFLGVADCDGVTAWRGDAFLACHSPESRLPADVMVAKPVPNVMSAYVIRLNLKAGKLIYATRIGGNGFTGAFRIKVDQQGFAYVVGFTKARDFPTTRR